MRPRRRSRQALAAARPPRRGWDATPAVERARCLERAAELSSSGAAELIALLVREAGKTLPDAVAEVREAVDFCRYYAARGRELFARPRPLPGPTGEHNTLALTAAACSCASRRGISRWRSSPARSPPRLAAGNAVVAKPAGQTPLIAARRARAAARGRRAAARCCSCSRRRPAGRRACWLAHPAHRRRRLHRLDRDRARHQPHARRARRARSCR